MNKILPAIALTALAFSGPVLAQTTTTLSDGTVVETPAVVVPGPVFLTPEPAVVVSPTYIAAGPMPAYAASGYVQPDMYLEGSSTGRIKVSAPKYDSQGRWTSRVRPIGRP